MDTAVSPISTSCQSDNGHQTSSRVNSLQANVHNMLHGGASPSPAARFSASRIPRPGFLRRLNRQDEESMTLTGNAADMQTQMSMAARSPLQPYSPLSNRISGTFSAFNGLSRAQSNAPVTPNLADESHVATLAPVETERQRESRRRAQKRQRRAWTRKPIDRGRCCFGCAGNTSPRRKFWNCVGSGSILLIILTTYLGIALTHDSVSQPVHVLFILVILLITVFFCHALIRLCMHLLRPSTRRSRIPSLSSPDGFNPDEPIRVHVASDAEAAGADDDDRQLLRDSKGLLAPPPAYGLWRSSVRVNPNLLHWQPTHDHATTAPNEATSRPDTAEAGPVRPPSYISDEGVEYVLHAAPRSTIVMPPQAQHQTQRVDHAAPTAQSRSDRQAQPAEAIQISTRAALQQQQPEVPSPPRRQGSQPRQAHNQDRQQQQEEPQMSQPASHPNFYTRAARPTPASDMSARLGLGAPLPPPPISFTPFTSSSIYSEHTPPIVQEPDFGGSLVEQMLLHPAYRNN